MMILKLIFVVHVLIVVPGNYGFQGIPSPRLTHNGVARGRLTHWLDYHNLDVARSTEVIPGSPLDIIFRVIKEQQEPSDSDKRCRMEILGSTYEVTNSSVFDQNGNEAVGITAHWQNMFPYICGVTIQSYDEEEFAAYDFTVKAIFDSHKIFGFVSLEDEVTSGLRLSEQVFPIHQSVFIKPDYESGFGNNGEFNMKYFGITSIDVQVNQPQDCIIVHADEMQILSVTIKDYTGNYTIGWDFQRTFVYICPDQQFSIGSHQINIEFNLDTTLFVRDPSFYQYGLYFQSCTSYENEEKVCWYTQGESTIARNIMPCFDEPKFKVKIQASVTKPTDDSFSILSNMPLQSIQTIFGQETYVFEETPVMSPYLFALAITNYHSIKSPERQNLTIWCSEEDFTKGKADYSGYISERLFNFYEDYFGIVYTLPKMDFVSEEKKGTAMENWGLSLFDPDTLLLDPHEIDGISDARWRVSSYTAHEIVHQWFGNLVTMSWWDQLWLNEGFAKYLSILGANLVDSENLPWARFVVEEMFTAMQADSDTDQHWALSDPVISRDDVHRKFGVFTYSKGASVIRMMKAILKEPVIKQGMTNYLKAFAYESTIEDDIFFYLDEAGQLAGTWPGSYSGSLTFSDVMKLWTNQAGYPIITAVVNCSNPEEYCKVDISQTMYVTSGLNDPARGWTVPIFASFPSTNANAIFWLEEVNTVVTIDMGSMVQSGQNTQNTTLILNQESFGYYRVMYDTEHWLRIADVIRENKKQIPVLTRLSILCDVHDFYKNGWLPKELFERIISAWEGSYTQEEQWAVKKCST